jgi:hypothetical protein
MLLVMRPQRDHVGYVHLDGTLLLRKRKRQAGDEPRPQKVRVFVCVWGGGCVRS